MKLSKLSKLSKLCALFLALALLTVSVVSASAAGGAETPARGDANSGTCGDGVTWSISGGKLTISGSGKMMDFLTWDHPEYPYPQPWYNRQDITSLEIGSGITYIGLNAFRNLKGLTSVTIPANVEGVGFAAFCDCSGLTEITLNAKKIGEAAFIRCTSLSTVTIGPNVTDIGISVFEGDNGLSRVNISDIAAWCKITFGGLMANPVEKAMHLYLNGSELTSLTVPAGITKINDYAFINAKSVTSVTLPEGLTEIGEYAFYGCTAMNTLNFPSSSLKRIGGYAFESCTGLRTLSSFPASIEYYGAFSFRFIPLAEYLTIPGGYIGRGAFEDCGTVGILTLGEHISYISENAFKGLPLRQLIYEGSQAQWDAIPKEAGNDSLSAAPMECRGTSTANPGIYTGKAEVSFGSYKGGSLTWLVLDNNGGKTLLLSKYILDFLRFDEHSQDISWADSDLRAWLNGAFLNGFSAEQQNVIVSSQVPSSSNSTYGTTSGPETTDKVFLLSEQEVRKYFPYEEAAAARCTAGAYDRSDKDPAISDPNGSNSFGNTSYWWLRTRGMYNYQAEYVDYLGYVHAEGMTLNNTITGVRPAMWVESGALYGGVYDFVTRCYKLILNREPDAGGLADWVGQLTAKTKTAAEIIYGFMYSDEYTNRNLTNEQTVEILYNAMLNRPSDEGGRTDWLGRLANGQQIVDIIAGFCGSAEFTNLCAEYGIEPGKIEGSNVDPSDKVQAFVVRCYQLMLNREPDAAGLADWTAQLKARTKNASEIIYGFMYSAEYTNRNLSNAETVEILYNAMLNRPSDEGGKTDWLDRLANGAQVVDIINGFCGSAEFNALCAEYGIEPGHVAVGAARVIAATLPAAAVAPTDEATTGIPVISDRMAAFINRCYLAALDREAGEVELNEWAVLFANTRMTPRQIAKAVLFSDEAKARLGDNEAFVRVLYRLYFNREADEEGLAFWTEKLNAGESRDAVADGFANADEFKAVLREMKQ